MIQRPLPSTGRRLALAASALLAVLAGPALADKAGYIPAQRGVAPATATITGSPLTVLVGAEHSFQIVNDQVPGSGQIFPSQTTGLADMGWMVRAGGTLYTPDFRGHPAGSATSSLGSITPYTAGAINGPAGSGSEADPFVVTVDAALGGSGLTSRQEVRYVNGKNFFSKRFTLTNSGAAPQDVKIYLGGDIYLAASDNGIPYREGASGSPGGSDCGSPASYYILYIPQTPADSYTGNGYSNVWSQIGNGDLDGALSTSGCMDNGAALQWNRTLAAGASVTILAATSFGEIPSIAQFDISSVTPASGAQGASVPVTIRGIGFAAGMSVAFGNGIGVADLTVVDAGTATATLTIAADATVGLRDVTGVNAGGTLTATLRNGFQVTGSDGPPTDPFTLTRVTPSSARVGTSLQVTLQGTGFASGMAVSFADGITVSNLNASNATTATATLTIAADAAVGPRTVSGTNAAGDQSASLPNGFTVLAGSPPSVAQPVPSLSLSGLLLLMLGLVGTAWAIFRR